MNEDHVREWNEVHRFSPDGWLLIPDFDIAPADVDFAGFEEPLLIPANPPAAESVRGMLSSARRLLRTEVTSIQEFREQRTSAYEVLSEDPDCELSPKQRAAVVYDMILHAFRELRGWGGDREAIRTTELAFAGEILTRWALDGVSAAQTRMAERDRDLSRKASDSAKQRKGTMNAVLGLMRSYMLACRAHYGTSYEIFRDAWLAGEEVPAYDDVMPELEELEPRGDGKRQFLVKVRGLDPHGPLLDGTLRSAYARVTGDQEKILAWRAEFRRLLPEAGPDSRPGGAATLERAWFSRGPEAD